MEVVGGLLIPPILFTFLLTFFVYLVAHAHFVLGEEFCFDIGIGFELGVGAHAEHGYVEDPAFYVNALLLFAAFSEIPSLEVFLVRSRLLFKRPGPIISIIVILVSACVPCRAFMCIFGRFIEHHFESFDVFVFEKLFLIPIVTADLFDLDY